MSKLWLKFPKGKLAEAYFEVWL